MRKLQTKIEKLARNDAYEYGVAGLLVKDLEWKNERIPGYGDAFSKAYDELDLSTDAKFLAKARKSLEKKGFTGGKVPSKFKRNVKIVLIVGGTVWVLNEMGYLESLKQRYRRGVLVWNEMQDPESETYKNFIDDMANKFGTWLDGGEKGHHYKNKRTVEGETLYSSEDTPEQQENLHNLVQEKAEELDDEKPWTVSDAPESSPSNEE